MKILDDEEAGASRGGKDEKIPSRFGQITNKITK